MHGFGYKSMHKGYIYSAPNNSPRTVSLVRMPKGTHQPMTDLSPFPSNSTAVPNLPTGVFPGMCYHQMLLEHHLGRLQFVTEEKTMPGSSLRVKGCGWWSQSCALALFYLGIHVQLISPAVLVLWNLVSSLRVMLETGSTCEGQVQLCAWTCLSVGGWLLDPVSSSEFSSSILSNEQHRRNGLVFLI